MQKKVIADIKTTLESINPKLEAIIIPNFSNTGKLSIQYKDKVGELASINYDFQRDTMTFSIVVGGKKIPSQLGRSDYFDFYMNHNEISDYERFKNSMIINLKGLG